MAGSSPAMTGRDGPCEQLESQSFGRLVSIANERKWVRAATQFRAHHRFRLDLPASASGVLEFKRIVRCRRRPELFAFVCVHLRLKTFFTGAARPRQPDP